MVETIASFLHLGSIATRFVLLGLFGLPYLFLICRIGRYRIDTQLERFGRPRPTMVLPTGFIGDLLDRSLYTAEGQRLIPWVWIAGLLAGAGLFVATML